MSSPKERVQVTSRQVILRRTAVRILLAVLTVGLGFGLAHAGRGHTLLVDNKSLTLEGREVPALGMVQVSLNGGKPVEVARLERIKSDLGGSTHHIKAEIVGGMGLGKTVEATFTLGPERTYLLSLPALFDGGAQENWLKIYLPPTAP